MYFEIKLYKTAIVPPVLRLCEQKTKRSDSAIWTRERASSTGSWKTLLKVGFRNMHQNRNIRHSGNETDADMNGTFNVLQKERKVRILVICTCKSRGKKIDRLQG
jgi:hypothetical protein